MPVTGRYNPAHFSKPGIGSNTLQQEFRPEWAGNCSGVAGVRGCCGPAFSDTGKTGNGHNPNVFNACDVLIERF
jgi:hypothetical protein